MKIKRIGIIGAGISGLVSAKTFLEEGYDVTIFEKKPGLGGVWEKSRTYPELTTQSNKDKYCFSDYPMPVSYPEWPTAKEMRDYLESYAKHFGIIDKIHYETEVISVSRKADEQPVWIVTVEEKDANGLLVKEKKYEFDFAIICNGIFSMPNVPSLPGKEEFTASGGLVLHSTDFNDTSMIADKKVVIIGAGKSACDIASVAANSAKECTLVFRQAMWKVPRFFLGLVNSKYILLTRLSEAWYPYHKIGKLETILHSICKPLVWLFWRSVEILLRLQLGLDSSGMLPDYQIEKIDCSATVASPDFFKYIRAGKIRPIKTTIAKFISGGVELATGQHISADVVIFGTGFNQSIPFLEEKYRQMLIDEEGNFQLYRHLIHPDIPQMGFLGYNSSLYSQLTAEVGAWWLVDYVNGKLSLPSIPEMYEEIATELDWMKTRFVKMVVGGNCIVSFTLRYVEQLISDMDRKHQVKIWKNILQVIAPVDMSRYHKIRQELKSHRVQSNLIVDKN